MNKGGSNIDDTGSGRQDRRGAVGNALVNAPILRCRLGGSARTETKRLLSAWIDLGAEVAYVYVMGPCLLRTVPPKVSSPLTIDCVEVVGSKDILTTSR